MRVWIVIKAPYIASSMEIDPYRSILSDNATSMWTAHELFEDELELLEASGLFHVRWDDPAEAAARARARASNSHSTPKGKLLKLVVRPPRTIRGAFLTGPSRRE